MCANGGKEKEEEYTLTVFYNGPHLVLSHLFTENMLILTVTSRNLQQSR